MKAIIISIIVAVALIVLAFVFGKGSLRYEEETASVNNVTVFDGRQIIEIKAKGGYQPRKTSAKAGIPTVIRFDTEGTFDCSSSVRIPSLNISKILPQSGTVDIDIGTREIGTLYGTCGMGMYPFEIDFQA